MHWLEKSIGISHWNILLRLHLRLRYKMETIDTTLASMVATVLTTFLSASKEDQDLDSPHFIQDKVSLKL